jgi:hypothetical protein
VLENARGGDRLEIVRLNPVDLVRVDWKSFSWGQGVGCGVWGFTHFQTVNYLIFRKKVPEFSPRSLQWSALFEEKKV